MDFLKIVNLKVNTKIGIYAWEQAIYQPLLIDIIIPYDFTHCADNIEATIDYQKMSESVCDYLNNRSFKLIETVAVDLADHLKSEFKLEEITLTVGKPHALKNADNVQVCITR